MKTGSRTFALLPDEFAVNLVSYGMSSGSAILDRATSVDVGPGPGLVEFASRRRLQNVRLVVDTILPVCAFGDERCPAPEPGTAGAAQERSGVVVETRPDHVVLPSLMCRPVTG